LLEVIPALRAGIFFPCIVLTIYIEIYRLFDKILRFIEIGKSTEIFCNISPSIFGSLEKIRIGTRFKRAIGILFL
jgi:hypothetical protein